MRVEVVKRFRDRHTLEVYVVGQFLEITKERFDEIMRVGALVRRVPETPVDDFEPIGANEHTPEALETLETPVDAPRIDFEAMTVRELKEYASKRGIEIKNGAKKADIISLLEAEFVL